jgi:hypothetical protein
MNERAPKDMIRMARLAISELFLDTHLEEEDFVRLRDVLKESQLSIDKLDLIYYEEIAPLLYGNLESTAGEWSGFEPDWLEQEISKQSSKRIVDKVPWLSKVRGYWVTRTTKNDWQKLKRMLTTKLL